MLSIPSPASSMEATGRSEEFLWMASTRGWVSIAGAAVDGVDERLGVHWWRRAVDAGS